MPQLSEEILLSENIERIIKIARSIARENMNAGFAPAHLLKALLHKEAGLHQLLRTLHKDIYYLEEWAEVRIEMLEKCASRTADIVAGEEIEMVMNEANSIRLKLMKDAIEPLHVLAALSTPGVGFTYEQLKSFPLRRDEVIRTAAEKQEAHAAIRKPARHDDDSNQQAPRHALLKYCIDKSLLAREGLMDAIVGRDKEIRMMAEILCRRSKPNVLIIGDPGVGKSALVDGFAWAILSQKVPQLLYNARIFELNTGSLVAGASYKGEIEDRLKSIVSEIRQYDKSILFIDEIHTLIDKHGSAAGAINLLKPELARGEITVIGATTLEEYRKHIQKDEALNRRFETLTVDEPDSAACFQMVRSMMPNYEKHHRISVPDESVKLIISMAKRYIKERRLPDAAIDLADRAMAALRMINDTGRKDIAELRKTIGEWTEKGKEALHSLEDWQWLCLKMKNQISPILWSAFQSEEDPGAMSEVEEVKGYIQKALEALESAATITHTEVSKSDVTAIVSYKTGIPVGKVQAQEKEKLLNMEAVLKQRVVGQDSAIKTISEAILESRSGLNKAGQPIGSFFFLGPTGTGKTELAKALAEFLFQDDTCMIRFDMSEFKEEHAAALLYGAPPGYVGYEEGGLLVNKIRQKPYSVVLFDEIEKAHSSVFDLFLQIMDEGKLHDKLGKEGDFSNALIIFTSNIGSQYVEDSFNKGEIPSSAKLMGIMGEYFRPEFLGRLTEIVPFASISEEMVKNILQIQLKGLYEVLHKKGIRLSISDAACASLAQLGFTPKYGARPLSGVIRAQLRRPLSKMIISGELEQGARVYLDVNEAANFSWRRDNQA